MTCCAHKKLVIINDDIISDSYFVSNTIYVIVGEVRVMPKITLHVECGTNIYITNGIFEGKNNNFLKSKLIFETGSKLFAGDIYFSACDFNYVPVKLADNGGVFFLGSSSKAQKDFVSSDFSTIASFFSANLISLSYLGGKDAPEVNSETNPGTNTNTNTKNDNLDDYDAISIVGVNNNEWAIKKVYSEYSGDDGFDVENSSISLESVEILNPTEDGLNITSSRVNILNKLVANVALNVFMDRDIFDLEIDDGPTFIRLEKGCFVDIEGIFGDELTLVSDDLPQPCCSKPYKFVGFSQLGQTYIYRGNFVL